MRLALPSVVPELLRGLSRESVLPALAIASAAALLLRKAAVERALLVAAAALKVAAAEAAAAHALEVSALRGEAMSLRSEAMSLRSQLALAESEARAQVAQVALAASTAIGRPAAPAEPLSEEALVARLGPSWREELLRQLADEEEPSLRAVFAVGEMMGRLGGAGASGASGAGDAGGGFLSPAAAGARPAAAFAASPAIGYEEFKATPPGARPPLAPAAALAPLVEPREGREEAEAGGGQGWAQAAGGKGWAAEKWREETPREARRPAPISTTPHSGSLRDSPVEPGLLEQMLDPRTVLA